MVLVAAPAQRTPRSARIHSIRVAERMAQTCSAPTPRARSPEATARTRSSVCAQLRLRQPPSAGWRKASRSGVCPTRQRNSSGTVLGAVSAKAPSSPVARRL